MTDALTGTVERITYYNEENGYGVIKIKPDKRITDPQARDKDGLVSVVGTMPELGAGETVQLTGAWITDAKYGRQFRIETVTPIAPSSLEGIRRYLASGIVKGIGEATAAKIVDTFGLHTIDILNNNPERLAEVTSLKPGLAPKLARAWADNAAVRSTMIFLQQYGVSSRMANRIHGHFGTETVSRVQKDPYVLADEVFGIGFIKADQIARNMGLATDSRERLRAGLFYALNQMAMDGHTYAPRTLLTQTACDLLKVDEENQARLGALLDMQLFSGDLIGDDLLVDGETVKAVYLPSFYKAESGAAQRLRLLAETHSQITDDLADTEWVAYLAQLAAGANVALTAQQQSAVQAALTSKVSILTGGPGTGKTTTLQMVIAALVDNRYTFALACPTGRAAKRLQEASGYNAFTIHRLLGYSPSEGFISNEDDPLDVQFLIVDESSMIDLVLFNHLLRALKPTTHLMLVGDVDQLPSVGAGNVLRDVIESGIAHVTRLQTIFRQSEDSHIIVNAHRINHGEAPFMDNQSRDFFFFSADDASRAADLLLDIVTNRLPRKFAEMGKPLDVMSDIQVIAPMYRGAAGVHALNELLQSTLNNNPRLAQQKIGGRVFRVGDKVMQTRNNYEKSVFNGDIGRITGIDDDDNRIVVAVDGAFIDYDYSEAEELIHAYCISTHRSQGSEYPVVVMPLLTQHYMMLQRNLLYTAITRAKQMVVLVGDRKAVFMAVSNNKVSERYSGLLRRLRGF
ncbi:MAG: ATP-dependent RecD-like DNA helicase [Armatimonadetes bacterium]|nr:ATP-dependent RecD-like DNA helicase [Anaerolineae bacterium]